MKGRSFFERHKNENNKKPAISGGFCISGRSWKDQRE
jgi:hypothetical protein